MFHVEHSVFPGVLVVFGVALPWWIVATMWCFVVDCVPSKRDMRIE